MVNITFELSKEHNIYQGMTIHEQLVDGQPAGWRILAHDKCVFYNKNAKDTEIDPLTMEETPVTYYYTIAYYPRNYNWDNFALEAVYRDSVDSRFVFDNGANA